MIQPATLEEMRRLVATLNGHDQAVGAAYVDGYRDGHRSGWEIGYDYRIREEEAAWKANRDVRGPGVMGTTGPERAALDRAYTAGVPCSTPHASRCSRCIRAAAVAHRGGDYRGGPVSWETSRPLRRSA